MTPYQSRLAMEATAEQLDKQAWLIAAFMRVKKIPEYKELSSVKKIIKSSLEIKSMMKSITSVKKV